MARVKVTLIGLDRVGASLGLAIKHLSSKEHQFTVVGTDTNAVNMTAAKKLNAVDSTEKNVDVAVEGADLIFISTPYGVVEQIFEAIGPALRSGAVVIDASPLKQPSLIWAGKHFNKDSEGNPEAYLVGATPVINPIYLADTRTETDAASADLFDDGLLLLSPATDVPEAAIKLVVDFLTLLGIEVRFIDPVEHDGIVGATYGLPMLLQLAYFRTLRVSAAWDDLRKLSNIPFNLSTYLLDQHRPEDAGAIVFRNRESVIRNLNAMIETLTDLRDVMTKGDEFDMAEIYKENMLRYVEWRASRTKNEWEESHKIPEVSLFGNLFGRRIPKDEKDKKS
jgi:prephenate dehydrogenase